MLYDIAIFIIGIKQYYHNINAMKYLATTAIQCIMT